MRSKSTGYSITGECQISDMLAIGSTQPLLVMEMRSNSGRYIAYSVDSGATWLNVSMLDSLAPQTPCEGSLTSATYKGAFRDTHLFLTAPHATTRTNLTLFSSSDGGHTWRPGTVLWEGPSAYSSLVYRDLKLYCLYERGEKEYWETLTLGITSPLI